MSDTTEVRKEIPIQPAAQTEITRLHQDLVAKAKVFEESRVAFNEFIKAVRHTLGIEDNQPCHIKEDASAFVKADREPAPEVVG